MIETSQKFKEIMASRFRPQSKVLIKLYNINKDDESVDDIYLWETKDIIDFEYERQIDPLGRENSSIVFRWKERYKGAKNIYGEAEKYKNLKIGCKVELTIFQSLGFKTQWEQLFNSNRKWKDLFETPMTWKNVFQNSLFEPIKLPTVFLYALPKYTNDVIEWEARDILSFMANNFVYYISPKNTEKGEPRHVRDIADLLFWDNYNYLTIRYLASAFKQCRENAKELSYMYNNEEVDIIACLIQEPSIDALRKIVAVYGGYYCDFNLDGSVKFKSILKNDWYTNTNTTIPRSIMYKEPKLIKPIYAQSITSQYYNYTPNYDSPVKVKNDGWLYSGDFEYSTFFKYPQYATAYKKNGDIDYKIENGGTVSNSTWTDDLTGMYLKTASDYGAIELSIYTISDFSTTREMGNFEINGAIYEEDNNLNCLDHTMDIGDDRLEAILNYFSPKKTSEVEVPNMEISIAGNVSIETGDVYNIEGAVIDNKKIYFPELIVYHKIKYNGTINSELKTHGMEVI